MRAASPLFALMLATSLAGCSRRDHAAAVVETRKECATYLAAREAGPLSCGQAAAFMERIAAPFGDVSNDRELAADDDAYLTGCMDQLAGHTESCKDDRRFSRALDRLMIAIMK